MTTSEATSDIVLLTVLTVLVVSVLRVKADEETCSGDEWMEQDKTSRWVMLLSARRNNNTQHPPVITHLPWATLKEHTRKLNKKLANIIPDEGRSLPLLTCHTLSGPCSNSSSDSPCTKVAKKALCVAMGGVCQALIVSIEEPTRCCCSLGERNTALTGRVTKVRHSAFCPTSFKIDTDGTGGKGRREKGSVGPRKEIKEMEGTQKVVATSSEGITTFPTLHQSLEEVDDSSSNTTGGEEGEEREERSKKEKKSNVVEDAIAGFVFLFIAVVLVAVKSRVFRFTKKKQEEEDREMGSEETLVEEAHFFRDIQ